MHTSLRSGSVRACGSMAFVHWGIFHSPNPLGPFRCWNGPHNPTAHTEAHSVTGRFAFLRRTMSSGVRGDHLLGHPEQEKDGLSRDRGIKRNEMSIYAAKALYRPDPSEATFAVTDDQPNHKYRLYNPNKLLSLGWKSSLRKPFWECHGIGETAEKLRKSVRLRRKVLRCGDRTVERR